MTRQRPRIGGLWLWASAKRVSGARPLGWLVWFTLGACVLITLVMILIAFASSGVLLAAGTVVIAGLLNIRLARRLRAAQPRPAIPRMAAAALTVAPIVALVAQSALVAPVTTYGRNRVIANSAPLIAEIERYYARHGAYPVSLFSVRQP